MSLSQRFQNDRADDEAFYSACATMAKPLTSTTDQDGPGWRPFVPGMLALTKTSIGSGVLALPYAVSHVGWGLGLAFMVITWVGGLVGQGMLFACANRAGGRETSWYSMAQCTFPGLSIFVDVIIGIKCVGVAASYLIVIGKLLPQTLVGLASPGSALLTKTFWITLFACGFCFPLSCLPSVKALRFSSMFGLLAVVYVALLVIVFFAAPEATGACSNVPVPCAPGISVGPTGEGASVFNVFETIPTFVFAFMMNTNVFMIFNEVLPPVLDSFATVSITCFYKVFQ
jgi:amino acid permease